jgi:DNA-binding transcriptional LysR family regulator
VAIVSRLAVTSEVAAGTLAVVRVEGLQIDRPLHLVRLRGRRDGPTTSAFCTVLHEAMKAAAPGSRRR